MIRRFKNRKFENFSWADYSESELALKINKAIRLSETIEEGVNNLKSMVKIFNKYGEMGDDADDSVFRDYDEFVLNMKGGVKEIKDDISELSSRLDELNRLL